MGRAGDTHKHLFASIQLPTMYFPESKFVGQSNMLIEGGVGVLTGDRDWVRLFGTSPSLKYSSSWIHSFSAAVHNLYPETIVWLQINYLPFALLIEALTI